MARTDPRPHYGTKRRLHRSGYVDLFKPDHELARRDGYLFEHRFLLHEAGISIPPGFQVHHRNGNKTDNRLENLAVIEIAEHTRLHARERTPSSCPQGHDYTPENTGFVSTTGWRYCKTCNRDRVRRYNAQKRAGLR